METNKDEMIKYYKDRLDDLINDAVHDKKRLKFYNDLITKLETSEIPPNNEQIEAFWMQIVCNSD